MTYRNFKHEIQNKKLRLTEERSLLISNGSSVSQVILCSLNPTQTADK